MPFSFLMRLLRGKICKTVNDLCQKDNQQTCGFKFVNFWRLLSKAVAISNNFYGHFNDLIQRVDQEWLIKGLMRNIKFIFLLIFSLLFEIRVNKYANCRSGSSYNPL